MPADASACTSAAPQRARGQQVPERPVGVGELVAGVLGAPYLLWLLARANRHEDR